METTTIITPDNLNNVMEFDHVIEVHEDGTVTDCRGTYAPELYNDVLLGEGWTLLDGYSGQDRYSGPIMHESESIGGRMARDILDTPGIYVALVAFYDPEDEDSDGGADIGGWAVATRLRADGDHYEMVDDEDYKAGIRSDPSILW